MSELPMVSVVIPVFNEVANLDELIRRCLEACRKADRPFEIILVDDGSRDGSWERIRELSAGREWVRGIRLMRNSGQHNALLCGIRAARKEVIVTIDDDLQHPPEIIGPLLAKLEQGFDVVYVANILHMLGPEGCVDLLRKAAAALEPGGRLLLKDFFLDDDRCRPDDLTVDHDRGRRVVVVGGDAQNRGHCVQSSGVPRCPSSSAFFASMRSAVRASSTILR